jgi:bifunctional non-homologous end joining protein LigD
MPNARFKSRTTFSATPRQPAKPRVVQPEASVGFASIPGAKAAAMPATLAPHPATLVKAPPAGAGWVHEIKYDGYRMLCRIEDGDARIISRNGKEWTEDFADIAHAAAKLSLHSAWLDGEICVVDHLGRSSFQALQNVLSNAPGTLVYFVFDLLYANGVDLRGAALLDRKRALKQ